MSLLRCTLCKRLSLATHNKYQHMYMYYMSIHGNVNDLYIDLVCMYMSIYGNVNDLYIGLVCMYMSIHGNVNDLQLYRLST